MRSGLRIEKLRRDHAVENFDCGKDGVNRFLVRHALQSQQSGASQTYVALSVDVLVGFCSLVFGQVEYEGAAKRLTKGPVPVMVLARLAVAAQWQGRGIGAGLLKDAMLRTLQAADIAGMRALVVHAKDEQARAFFVRFDVAPSPSDPLHLFVLLKDVRAMIRQ